MKIRKFRITEEQYVALESEAFKRAVLDQNGRRDASAVLREILDTWLAAQPKKGKKK